MAYHVAVNAAEVTHHNLSIVFMGVATIATVRLKLESTLASFPQLQNKGEI